MLEPPRRGGSNEYLQSMFWSKNKKNRYTPAYPSLLYQIKSNQMFYFQLWAHKDKQSNTMIHVDCTNKKKEKKRIDKHSKDTNIHHITLRHKLNSTLP